jgi:hypothetical protein
MRQKVLARVAALLAERRSGGNVDWIWVALVLAVLLLIAVGIFMSVAVLAQHSKAPW